MSSDQTSLIKEIAVGAAWFLIAFMQQWNASRAHKDRKKNAAAAKVDMDATKAAAAAAAADTQKVALVVHDVKTLVNSQTGATLNVARLATKRTAEVTNLPSDIAVAEEAERAYQEHQIKQSLVDAVKPK